MLPKMLHVNHAWKTFCKLAVRSIFDYITIFQA